MPTTRPQTPAAGSDTFSEPGSLSDLESGWTDISSNRSARRSFSINSDTGESVDACLIDSDRLVDSENWGNSSSEPEVVDADDDNISLINGVVAEDNGSETCLSTHLPESRGNATTIASSQNDSVISTTPHGSLCGSRKTLRLAFPDPLTSSNEDIFSPTWETLKMETQASEGQQRSNVAASDDTIIPPDYVVEDFDEAIILYGQPKAFSLKSAVMQRILLTKQAKQEDSMLEQYDSHVAVVHQLGTRLFSPKLVLILDLTSRVNMPVELQSLKCPIVSVLLTSDPTQPCLLASLNRRAKHLRLLLPSESNIDSSLLDVSNSDSKNRSNMDDSEVHKSSSVLSKSKAMDVHEFLALSNESMYELLRPPMVNLEPNAHMRSKATFLKSIHLHTILFSLPIICTVAIFMWTTIFSHSSTTAPPDISTPPTPPVVQVDSLGMKGIVALSPIALKSLAISVFQPHTQKVNLEPPEKCLPRLAPTPPSTRRLTIDPPMTTSFPLLASDRGCWKRQTRAPNPFPAVTGAFNSLAVRLTTALSPAITAIEHDLNELLKAIDVLLDTISRVQAEAMRKLDQSVDFVHALSKQVVTQVISWPNREVLSKVSKRTSHRVQKLPNYATESMHSLTDKVYSAALTVGKHASNRHSRAKHNARRVRNRVGKEIRRVERIFNDVKDTKLGEILFL